MYKGKPQEWYEQQAKALKDALPEPDRRIRVRVRDAMVILGYTSTSPTQHFLEECAKRGLLSTEKRGSTTEYFFVEKADVQNE